MPRMERKPLDAAAIALLVLLTALWGVQQSAIKLTAPDDWTMPAMVGLRVESTFRSLKVLTHNQYTEAALQQLRSSGAQIESVDAMSLEEIFINTVMRGREGVES